jgi:predicted restriction endonuclease
MADNSRNFPAAVRRELAESNDGRCAFVDEWGHRCNARCFLEFDHIHPHAQGGPPTVTNGRMLCHAHNALEAERAFGRSKIEAAIARASKGKRRE